MTRGPAVKKWRPPGLPRLLVGLCFRGELREVVLGDLDEGYVAVLEIEGRAAARRWYWWQSVDSLGALARDRAARTLTRGSRSEERGPERGERRMSWLWYDVRLAIRSLLRRPAFSLVAVLTVALGVGANVGIFTVIDGVLLEPLPYHEPQGLVSVAVAPLGRPADVRDFMSHPDIADLAAQSPALESLVGHDSFLVSLSGRGEPIQVQTTRVTEGLMETFRVAPPLGRDIRGQECGPGAPRVAVVSHGLWRDRLGMSPDAVGGNIELGGRTYEIVGVAPQGFRFPERTQLWIPHRLDPESCGRSCHTWRAIGRLAPGASLASSQAEADVVARNLAQTYPASNFEKGFRVESLRDLMVGQVRTPLWILLAAVSVVLLIACANVANLLLIRASSRRGEVAVRAALGASRGRLVAQVVVESGLLALVGGAAGLLLAAGGVEVLRVTSAGTLPRLGEIAVDRSVLLFTLGLVACVTLLFGSSPAAYLVRASLSANLLHAGRDGARGRMGRRSRGWLVGVEVALSVVLLVGAGLLLQTFGKLHAVDLGFQTEGIVRFNLSLPGVRYAELQDVRSFFRTLEDRLSVLPGVESVGSVYGAPLGDAHTTSVVLVAGRPEPPPGSETYSAIRAVSPGYLETLRIPLTAGRRLEPSDDIGTFPVGVVNQAFARENFPGEDPMGRRVRIKTDMGYGSPYWTIVGVVGDIRSHALTREPVPEIYVPHGQFGPGYMSVNVRAGLDPESLLPSIRVAVRALDPKLPLQAVETVEGAVRREVAPTRFYLTALGLFATLALSLAAVGLYGVLGYVVSQRTREIGVRVALGATRGGIVRMVVSDGLRPALTGIVAGLAVALSAGRVLEALLYDVASRDPLTLTSVPVVVLGVALLATLAPARRASRVDPVSTLRAE